MNRQESDLLPSVCGTTHSGLGKKTQELKGHMYCMCWYLNSNLITPWPFNTEYHLEVPINQQGSFSGLWHPRVQVNLHPQITPQILPGLADNELTVAPGLWTSTACMIACIQESLQAGPSLNHCNILLVTNCFKKKLSPKHTDFLKTILRLVDALKVYASIYR